MSELYKSLPDRVKKLSLNYQSQYMIGIRELANKKLDDVDLWTTLNNIDDDMGDVTGPGSKPDNFGWGIDANAFKNTAFISYDPNPVKNFENMNTTEKTAGSIQFNIIRPDKNSTINDVRNAFYLILNKHKDWRVYNGGFGDGSWPVKVDLLLTKFKSLRNINLYGFHFKAIKLHSETDIFTISAKELATSQFSSLVEPNWGPNDKPKILFDNKSVKAVHIVGGAKDLENTKWIRELQGLALGLKNMNKVHKIIVDTEDMKKLFVSSGVVDSSITIQVGLDNTNNEGEPNFD